MSGGSYNYICFNLINNDGLYSKWDDVSRMLLRLGDLAQKTYRGARKAVLHTAWVYYLLRTGAVEQFDSASFYIDLDERNESAVEENAAKEADYRSVQAQIELIHPSKLSEVWMAVEWEGSGDWCFDSVVKAMAEYETTVAILAPEKVNELVKNLDRLDLPEDGVIARVIISFTQQTEVGAHVSQG